jgi:FAD/FMN-containing dehydrogenase
MLYGDDGEAAAGSCAVLESGPVDLRRKVNVWGPPRTEWKFTEGIRRAFDPGRILNRGRYVGGN